MTGTVGLVALLASASCQDSQPTSIAPWTIETTAESEISPDLLEPWTIEELLTEDGPKSSPSASGGVEATCETWNEYAGKNARVRLHRQKFSKVVWIEAFPKNVRLSSVLAQPSMLSERHSGTWTIRFEPIDGRIERGALKLDMDGDLVERIVLLPHARDLPAALASQ